MARIEVKLKSATHPEWVNVILENFDAFMQDHANCERKASALALSMVMKYPDRKAMIPHLIRLAQEDERLVGVERIAESDDEEEVEGEETEE